MRPPESRRYSHSRRSSRIVQTARQALYKPHIHSPSRGGHPKVSRRRGNRARPAPLPFGVARAHDQHAPLAALGKESDKQGPRVGGGGGEGGNIFGTGARPERRAALGIKRAQAHNISPTARLQRRERQSVGRQPMQRRLGGGGDRHAACPARFAVGRKREQCRGRRRLPPDRARKQRVYGMPFAEQACAEFALLARLAICQQARPQHRAVCRVATHERGARVVSRLPVSRHKGSERVHPARRRSQQVCRSHITVHAFPHGAPHTPSLRIVVEEMGHRRLLRVAPDEHLTVAPEKQRFAAHRLRVEVAPAQHPLQRVVDSQRASGGLCFRTACQRNPEAVVDGNRAQGLSTADAFLPSCLPCVHHFGSPSPNVIGACCAYFPFSPIRHSFCSSGKPSASRFSRCLRQHARERARMR
jgi:hypothetical protein